MNYVAIALCCLVAAVSAMGNPEWESFKAEYGRQYRNPTEEAFRFKIFLDNKMAIDQHNQRYAVGKSTFTMGINQFTDLTNLEYSEMLNLKEPTVIISEIVPIFNFSGVSIPITVDWRTSGCVSPVKSEGGCHCCWALSAIACAEFYNCRSKVSLVRLSGQELVDCSSSYGNNGCNKGWMTDSFRYMIDNGISCESCYPYKAAVGVCSPCAVQCARFTSYVQVQPAGYESALTTTIANVGVVSVAIDASRPGFQFYKTGVYNDPACSKTINHAMLAVGYGVESNVPFYQVQNFWGTGWGANGYIKMIRNGSNQCCIACYGSYPVI